MSDLHELEQTLEECSTRSGADPRRVFVRLRPDPGGALWLECSDPGLLQAAGPQIQARAGSREIRSLLLPGPELRDRVFWVTASVADVRRVPGHQTEQVTQALQGEVLDPLLHEGGWVLARLPDGSVAWVRDWHLQGTTRTEVEAFENKTTARMASSWTNLRSAPRPDAEPVGETILGTRVVILERQDGWTQVVLPGGRVGWVLDPDLRSGTALWPTDSGALLATLGSFLGVPYVWGGKSPKGFDCSGLVQFVFGLHGVRLPRDSDEQAQCGVPAQTPQQGDLHFFGQDRVTHVGVVVTGDDFLHARGEVRRNSLDPASPLHDPELRALWLGTRRILGIGA